MKSKFEMFRSVIATRDLTEPDLMGAWGLGKPGLVDGKPAVLKGTVGAIVEIFENPPGLAVEFFDDDDETIDVAFIPESYVRAMTSAQLEELRRRSAELKASIDH
ncbi:MAG TPA: DUF4926 domain-containing protein [Dehalococcoidia bacterium]|nr:DUF4926 domain-containing protein [Dehalococcoidia bacterium]